MMCCSFYIFNHFIYNVDAHFTAVALPKTKLVTAGAPNSPKFRGHPRFDKGGVAIIFYFLRVKNITF